MNKLDTAYEDYIFKQNLTYAIAPQLMGTAYTKEKFTSEILNNDDFYENWGKSCSVPLTEEEIALNPDGPKRKLIEE
jgi:hypothetical protein